MVRLEGKEIELGRLEIVTNLNLIPWHHLRRVYQSSDSQLSNAEINSHGDTLNRVSQRRA